MQQSYLFNHHLVHRHNSSYKNHNTLVCKTPSGAHFFVSKLHRDSTSDRELFERSGLLSLLEPGDLIMADRGFTIADAKGVSLNIPPMKVGEQLSDTELFTTRRIATLRKHVERAIGRINNYKILNISRYQIKYFLYAASYVTLLHLFVQNSS